MANRSLSPVGDDCSDQKKWTPDADWKLINCEPAEDEDFLPAPEAKDKQSGPGPSRKGRDEEEEDEEKIADWSHINVESTVKKIGFRNTPEFWLKFYAATARNPGRSEQAIAGESQVDGEWYLMNAKTTDPHFVSHSSRNLRCCRFECDEPGPSAGKFPSVTEEAGPSKVHFRNDWMLINVEAPAQDGSSENGQRERRETASAEDHNLPGPSRTKKYNTILKKSNSYRQVVDDDWKLINIEEPGDAPPDSISGSPTYSTHCDQASQSVKLPWEKETKKHVHFDPRSECELFGICDERLARRNSSVDVCGTTSINYGGRTGRSLLGLTPKDMPPSDLNKVEIVKEKIKLACENDNLQAKFSLAANRNSSANNDPEERNSDNRQSPPSGPDNRENQSAYEQLTLEHALDNFEHRAGASDISEAVRNEDRASKSLTDAGHPDCRKTPAAIGDDTIQPQTDPRIGTKSQSHTERMVALFTNLQARQTSLPLPGEKIRKRKTLDGVVADHVQDFDERKVKITEEANTSSVAEKIQKVERVISPPRHSRTGSSPPCGSPKSLQGLEYDENRNEGFRHTNKQSVEAILVVLQSMRSILVRMAKMGTSTSEDGLAVNERNNSDVVTDLFKPKRKKAPYKFNCPKDREVMPDGLFAYSIAHQVVGQAFKKISELYPDCANRVQTESDPEKGFKERGSASTVLALTAMKDALRDLEGSGADKSYISTAVETSDSLTNISADNLPEEEQLQESYPAESNKIVLGLINEMIFEIVTSAEASNAKASNDDPMNISPICSASDVELKQSDRLEAELKQMSFELVSRTMREAVSALTNSCIPCDKGQTSASQQKKEMTEEKVVDAETGREAPCSTVLTENTHQRDEQSAACFMQSISNEVHELISKLFYHLQSVDSREELNAIITGVEADPNTAAEKFANTASKCNSTESSSHLTASTATEEGAADYMTADTEKVNDLQRKDKNTATAVDTNNDLAAVEENAETFSNGNDVENVQVKNCKSESLSSSNEPKHTASYHTRAEQSKESRDLYPCSNDENPLGRNNSEESVLTEELCQSNDSIKCVNSSSQTTDSSMERLFEMRAAAVSHSQSQTSRCNLLHSASREESLQYSTPSTLLRMRASDDRRENDILGSTGFGSLHFGRSSDTLLIPTGTVHMAGGNHPEHVQQADLNRPSCSSSPKNQLPLQNPQVTQRIIASKSVTADLDAAKRQGCWNCYPPCHHQQRVAKSGNASKNKRSFSEPKLDFYKRTKVLDCPRVRRRLFDSPQSNNSEWTVIGYYPPRPFSAFAAANNENIEFEDDDVYTLEFGEGVTAAEAEVIFGIMAASLPRSTASQPTRAVSASVDGQYIPNVEAHPSTATPGGANQELNALDSTRAQMSRAMLLDTETPDANVHHDVETERRACGANTRSGRVNPSPNVHEALAHELFSSEDGSHEDNGLRSLRNSSTQTCPPAELCTFDGVTESANPCHRSTCNNTTTSVPSMVRSHSQTVTLPPTLGSSCCPRSVTSDLSAGCSHGKPHPSQSKSLASHEPAVTVPSAQSLGNFPIASTGPSAACSFCVQDSATSTASASLFHRETCSDSLCYCCQSFFNPPASASDSRLNPHSYARNRESKDCCWRRHCVSSSMDRTSDHKSSSSDGVRGSVQTGNASVDPRDDSELNVPENSSFHEELDCHCGEISCCGERGQERTFRKFFVITNKNINGIGRGRQKRETKSRTSSPNRSETPGTAVDTIQRGFSQLKEHVEQELKEIKSTMTALSSAVHKQASREHSLQEVAKQLPVCSHVSPCTSSHRAAQHDNVSHEVDPAASQTCSVHSNEKYPLGRVKRQPSSSVDEAFAHRDCVPGRLVTVQRSSTAVSTLTCSRLCRQHSSEARNRDRCCISPQEASGEGARPLHSDRSSAARAADCAHDSDKASSERSCSAEGASHVRGVRGEEAKKVVSKTLSGCPAQGSSCSCHARGGGRLSEEELSASAIIQRFENSLCESASGPKEEAVAHRFVVVSTPPVDVDGYTELSGKNIAPVILRKFNELRNNNRIMKRQTDTVSSCAAAKAVSECEEGPQNYCTPSDKPAAHDDNAEAKLHNHFKDYSVTDTGKTFTHCCQTNTLSSGVVDAAFKVIESVLKSSNSGTLNTDMRQRDCQRLASSNVDGRDQCTQTQSVLPQAVTSSWDSVVETKGANILDRNGYSVNSSVDAGSLTPENSDATFPKPIGPVSSCKSESQRSCCKLAEERSLCCRSPSAAPSCNKCDSASTVKENPERTTENNLHDTEKEIRMESRDSNRTSECNDVSANLSTWPHTKWPRKPCSEHNKEDDCNSTPCECSAFLVCVGKKNGSSAYFVQPVTPPKTTQLTDSACQVSDDNSFTTVRDTAHLDDSDRSEASLAWSISPSEVSVLEREPCQTADNTNQRVRPLHGAVISFSVDGADFDASPLVRGSSEATRYQRSSTSPDSPKREASSSIDPTMRVRSVSEGICEISHSGCEACSRPFSVVSSSEVDDVHYLCHRKEKVTASDKRVAPRVSTRSPVLRQSSLSGLTDGGYAVGSVSHEVDPESQVKASKVSTASKPQAANSNNVAAATAGETTGGLCVRSDNSQGNSGKIISPKSGGDSGFGVSSVDKPVSCSVSVIRAGNVAPYYAVKSTAGAADPSTRLEDQQDISAVRVINCGSSHVDQDFSGFCGVDASDTGYSKDNNIVGSASASVDPDCCDTGVSAIGSAVNQIQTADLGTHTPEGNFSVGTESDYNQTAGFSFSLRQVAEDGLHTSQYDSGLNTNKDGGGGPRQIKDRRLSAPQQHFEFSKAVSGPPAEAFISPCSSSSTLSTASRPTPISSVTNVNSSSSHVDPCIGMYNPAWFSIGMSSKSSIGTQSNASSGLSFPGHEFGRRRSGVDGASRLDNGQRCPAGFSAGVDGRVNCMDGGVALTRSQSDEGLWGRHGAVSSSSKDTWTTLQLLNLSSRATRLALESRLESLHQILKKMESCEKPASSESLNKQGQSAERCSSNSSSNQSTAASAPPRDDNWLMACGSDELIQLVNYQLGGLKDAIEAQKGHQTAADASNPGQNTNTNYDASDTNAAISTPVSISIGTTASSDAAVSRVTFGDCFMAVDTADKGVRADDCEVKIDVMQYSDVYSIAKKRHRGMSVDADHGRANVVNFADSFNATETGNRGVSTENIYTAPSDVMHFAESFSVVEPVALHRGARAKMSSVRANVLHFSDSVDIAKPVYRGTSIEPGDAAHFADSRNPTETLQRRVRTVEADVRNFADSFSVHGGVVRGTDHKVSDVNYAHSASIAKTVPSAETHDVRGVAVTNYVDGFNLAGTDGRVVVSCSGENFGADISRCFPVDIVSRVAPEGAVRVHRGVNTGIRAGNGFSTVTLFKETISETRKESRNVCTQVDETLASFSDHLSAAESKNLYKNLHAKMEEQEKEDDVNKCKVTSLSGHVGADKKTTVSADMDKEWEEKEEEIHDTNAGSFSNNFSAHDYENQSSCVQNDDVSGVDESQTNRRSLRDQLHNSSRKCMQATSYSTNNRGGDYCTCRHYRDIEEADEDEAQDGSSSERSGNFSRSDGIDYESESDQTMMDEEEGEEESSFEEQEQEALTMDDVIDDRVDDEASNCNVGVQCDIVDDRTVHRSNAGVCGGCHDGPWSSCTVSPTNQYVHRSACDADRTQHEDTQAQLHLLLEKYRQRIKSLEYDLQLEKGLHETTRRSLESLRRDHSKFRSQVFSPHKEGNKKARDRLQDIFRRTEVTGDWCRCQQSAFKTPE